MNKLIISELTKLNKLYNYSDILQQLFDKYDYLFLIETMLSKLNCLGNVLFYEKRFEEFFCDYTNKIPDDIEKSVKEITYILDKIVGNYIWCLDTNLPIFKSILIIKIDNNTINIVDELLRVEKIRAFL